jgi:preprotein translocase subunit SecF
MTNPTDTNPAGETVEERALSDAGVDQATLPQHGRLARLYTGTGAFEIVGNRKRWYTIIGGIVLIAIASIVLRGFSLGIDFEGGTRIQFPAAEGVTTEHVEQVYTDAIGSEPVSVQTVGSGDSSTIQIRSEALDAGQIVTVQNALFDAFHPEDRDGVPSKNAISVADVSETWGSQITKKALIALAVFLVIVSVYIAIRFERDMAIAGIVALFFDMVVTAGVYSLIGLEVTPATVIGFLTILGFSLYDTVVVFDKVDENTRGVLHLTRRTYAEQANLAVNQTLMRSINTTVISILPVIGLLVVAVGLLGVGTLKDLAVVQLVGIVVGAFSSIFFATPMLVSIKERWGPVAAHTKKVLARRSALSGGATAAEAATLAGSVPEGRPSGRASSAPRRPGGAPQPGARPTGKRDKKRR